MRSRSQLFLQNFQLLTGIPTQRLDGFSCALQLLTMALLLLALHLLYLASYLYAFLPQLRIVTILILIHHRLEFIIQFFNSLLEFFLLHFFVKFGDSFSLKLTFLYLNIYFDIKEMADFFNNVLHGRSKLFLRRAIRYVDHFHDAIFHETPNSLIFTQHLLKASLQSCILLITLHTLLLIVFFPFVHLANLIRQILRLHFQVQVLVIQEFLQGLISFFYLIQLYICQVGLFCLIHLVFAAFWPCLYPQCFCLLMIWCQIIMFEEGVQQIIGTMLFFIILLLFFISSITQLAPSLIFLALLPSTLLFYDHSLSILMHSLLILNNVLRLQVQLYINSCVFIRGNHQLILTMRIHLIVIE